MNKKYKISIIIFTIMLLVIVSLSLFYSRKVDKYLNKDTISDVNLNIEPQYHFYAILKNYNEPYWDGIRNGIESMASTLNVAIEINYPDENDEYENALKLMDIAIKSNVDGIITFAYDTVDYVELIDAAFQKGIPVITINSDASQSRRSAYVGINKYDIGEKQGELVAKCSMQGAKVGMVLENDDNDINDNGTYMDGFKDAINKYDNIEIVATVISDTGVLDAQEAVQDIISNYRDVNVIVCTSSLDTIGAAQYVVDFNHVGNIGIVGYDSSDEIIDYLDKGVIYGTVVPDTLNLGINSINSLFELKTMGRTSSYVQTELQVVTKENLKEYIKNTELGGN
ncbi:MAG: substrate-binding domain-containing protein [Clostridiaceae bacterium]